MTEERRCPGCGVSPGQQHEPGCDVPRCCRCGRQRITCDCIYEVNGMDPNTLAIEHPDVYHNGYTPEMRARFEAEYGALSEPWSGLWPGVLECREYGWWARLNPYAPGWIPCNPNEVGASEDLNRLAVEARWDSQTKRYVRIADVRGDGDGI